MIPRRDLDGRLGSSFVERLLDRPHVTICGVSYSKNDLVTKIKIGNFAAAKRLEAAVSQQQAQKLTEISPLDLAKIEGVGETTIFVLLMMQDAAKVKPLEFEDVTWRTFVHHARNDNKGKGKKKR
jgi:hypothetical protein